MSHDKKTDPAKYPAVDRLIHEPVRYNVMALLYVVERAEYLFVLNQTKVTSGNLTAHVAKLENAGYLAIEKKFVNKKPKTFLKITAHGQEAFDDYRSEMKKRLDVLPDLGSERSGTGDREQS